MESPKFGFILIPYKWSYSIIDGKTILNPNFLLGIQMSSEWSCDYEAVKLSEYGTQLFGIQKTF